MKNIENLKKVEPLSSEELRTKVMQVVHVKEGARISFSLIFSLNFRDVHDSILAYVV
jgi:hypothetical protein